MVFKDLYYPVGGDEATLESYAPIEDALKRLAAEPPSPERFTKAAELFAKGFHIAAVPPVDIDTTRRPWVARALELMLSIGVKVDRLNYKFGDLHVPDEIRNRMCKAMASSFDDLLSWAHTVRSQYGKKPDEHAPQSIPFANFVLYEIDSALDDSGFQFGGEPMSRESVTEGFLFDTRISQKEGVERPFSPKKLKTLLKMCEFWQLSQPVENEEEYERALRGAEIELEGKDGLFDKRYADQDAQLRFIAKEPPSPSRFDWLCRTLLNGLIAARSSPIDDRLCERLWLPACLDLLCDDPYPGNPTYHDLIEVKRLLADINAPFQAMCDYAEAILQRADKPAESDKTQVFACEVAAIRDTLRDVDASSGANEPRLPFMLIYRISNGKSFDFNPSLLRKLVGRCQATAIDSVTYYKNKRLDGVLSDVAFPRNSTGAMEYASACSWHYNLMSVECDDLEKAVDMFKLAKTADARFGYLKRDRFAWFLSPFRNLYFRPASYCEMFANRIFKPDRKAYDASCKKRKSLIDSLLQNVARVVGHHGDAETPQKLWQEIVLLFNAREDQAFGVLGTDEQAAFENLFDSFLWSVDALSDVVKNIDLENSGPEKPFTGDPERPPEDLKGTGVSKYTNGYKANGIEVLKDRITLKIDGLIYKLKLAIEWWLVERAIEYTEELSKEPKLYLVSEMRNAMSQDGKRFCDDWMEPVIGGKKRRNQKYAENGAARFKWENLDKFKAAAKKRENLRRMSAQ